MKTVAIVLLALIALVASACAPTGRARATGASGHVRDARDIPTVLRGTIGTQVSIRGMEPMLCSGYGVVVDLNGTGSGDIPGPVRALLEREMTRLGVGLEIGALRDITPTEMLNDKNTAVVLVQAVISPGSPKGSTFDVEVTALPGTSTTSLEGGRLFTTELFPGLVRPVAPTTAAIAEAQGQLFINPFSDPDDPNSPIVRTIGRILDGGRVVEPRLVTLELDTPSHTRARAIADAINARFPRDRGAPPVARGRNNETVEINIPAAYRDDTDEFVQLLRYTRVDQSFPDQAALRYARALKDNPSLANALMWCFRSLGPVSIPHLRQLYDYSEEIPRRAAITAGAHLGDMAVKPHLEEMIGRAPVGMKPELIELLAELDVNPTINILLRDLLDHDEYSVRIAAFETLKKRGDPWMRARRIDDKFVVISVPSAHPMVYVTMVGEPTIVLFGAALEISRPVFVSAWEGRLMLRAEKTDREINIYYRDHRTDRSMVGISEPELTALVEYLGHETTPEEPAPGLNLSYAEVVGALSQICDKGGVNAVFISELDRFALELQRSMQTRMSTDRPELSELDAPAEPAELLEEGFGTDALIAQEQNRSETLPEIDSTAPEDRPRKTYVVPLGQKPR